MSRADLPAHADLIPCFQAARTGWGPSPPPGVAPDPIPPGGESVWDYPRPPEVRQGDGPVRVEAHGVVLAESARALRIVETAGAPVYYLPPNDVRMDLLRETPPMTLCEWKGAAVHYAADVDGRTIERVAFAYPDPVDDLGRGFHRIAGWIAFYPAVAACFVADEPVRPQDGGLYAGWVTARIAGPIKGGPGTGGW